MFDFMKNKNGVTAIELGKKYKDSVHGIEGVATCHSRYITGCDRVCLEYKSGSDIKEIWVDITRLENIDIAKESMKMGGPQSVAPAKTTG